MNREKSISDLRTPLRRRQSDQRFLIALSPSPFRRSRGGGVRKPVLESGSEYLVVNNTLARCVGDSRDRAQFIISR